MFFKQWRSLKEHVRSKGIRIIGDLPLFVAHDSSDVWANQHLFRLDEHGMPEAVAGVPPDYFSSTGQLWGNPQYDWQAMHQDSYRWWRERFRLLLKQVDIVRIDHFRGFEAYWEVPGEEKTAVNGKWVKGPGKAFFTAMDRYLGHLPVIAENLGVITPQVEQLREKFNFPGMKVLQFCFSADWYGKCSADDCEDNMVVYTGTHDNNTSLGWYESLAGDYDLSASIRKYLDLPQGASPGEFCRRFIERAYANQACIAIIPLQDLLSLGDKARMNLPGTVGGNWNWRYRDWALTSELADNLAGLTAQYQR